ncbi:hypothetical protein EMIHUDRAFT_256593, partial [Emiliania huxleyi CCMP1516]
MPRRGFRLLSDSPSFADLLITADKADLVVGRSIHADYRIANAQISGTHCTLRLTPSGRLKLTDTSSNGTFVNGREIARFKTVDVRRGSTITFLVASVDERDAEYGDEVPAFTVCDAPPQQAVAEASPGRETGRVLRKRPP